MGLWDYFVAARSAGSLANIEGVSYLTREGDWDFARVEEDGAWEGVAGLADRLASPAIEAFVMDSDFAAVRAAAPGVETSWLAINTAYGEENPTDELSEQWRSPRLRREAAESLAAWSTAHAPRATTADEIAAVLEDDEIQIDDPGYVARHGPHILFAEDGLRGIFEKLGFPSLDETVFARP